MKAKEWYDKWTEGHTDKGPRLGDFEAGQIIADLAAMESFAEGLSGVNDQQRAEIERLTKERDVLKTGLFPEAYGENIGLCTRAEAAESLLAALLVRLDTLVDAAKEYSSDVTEEGIALYTALTACRASLPSPGALREAIRKVIRRQISGPDYLVADPMTDRILQAISRSEGVSV